MTEGFYPTIPQRAFILSDPRFPVNRRFLSGPYETLNGYLITIPARGVGGRREECEFCGIALFLLIRAQSGMPMSPDQNRPLFRDIASFC